MNLTGTTVLASLDLAPLGVDPSQQRYVFPSGTFTVATANRLNFLAGSKVQVNPNATVAVSGTLSVDSPASFAAPHGGGDNTVAVASGGTLTVTGATFSSTGGVNYNNKITVASGGTFAAANSTFGWDLLTLDNASALGTVTNNAFGTVLTTPAKHLPAFAGAAFKDNKSFQDVNLTGTTVLASLDLAPLGVDPSQQRYVFPSGTFTVFTGTTLNFLAGSKVQVNPNATVAVSGTLSVDSPASFAAPHGGGDNTVAVASGGTLTVTGATFSSTGGVNYNNKITVASGGTFAAANSTFGWDLLTLDPNALVGVVTGSSFDTVLTTPAKHLPAFAGAAFKDNQRFRDVNITTGTNDPVLSLAPLGVDPSQQRYVFPSGTFTVFTGTTLNFLAGSKVQVNPNATVAVSGTLSVDSPASFAAPHGGGDNTVAVASGGTLTVTGATFSSTGGVNYNNKITVASGGTFAAANSTFGWDLLTLDNAAKLGVVTGSAFDTILTTPSNLLPVFAGTDFKANTRFRDVILTGTTTLTSLGLAPLGADPSQQRYVFPSGTFTVAAATAFNFTAKTNVYFAANASVSVKGTLTVDSPAQLHRPAADNNTIAVANGGTFKATNTNFTTAGGTGGANQINVASGGTISAVGNSLGWTRFYSPAIDGPLPVQLLQHEPVD